MVPAPGPTASLAGSGRVSASRIGIFGGTFDPVHAGHLVAAVNVRQMLGLDRVLLVVANRPWQKLAGREPAPAADRLAVVRAAAAGLEGVEASDLEIARGGDSYTADTVDELHRVHPGAELFVIVGADLLPHLESWHHLERVRDSAVLVVVSRPGHGGEAVAPPDVPGWKVLRVPVPSLDISSTDLRSRVADGRPLDFLVPPAAVRCIMQRRMYAVAG